MTPPDDRNWQPATFRERGVAVPFTNPLLTGARVRVSERQCDLVVPHLGGARGVYILALASLAEFCVPTLHDSELADRLMGLPSLTPATIRGAARLVAAEGLAGRAAAQSVTASIAREKTARSRFEITLLQATLGKSGGDAGLMPEQRTAEAVRKLAGRTGRDAEAVHADIVLLSSVVVAAGLDCPGLDGQGDSGTVAKGRCTGLLQDMETMRAGISEWASSVGTEAPCAAILEAALITRLAGQQVLAAAHKLLEDPAALLTAWATGAEHVAHRLGRPDWVLDGWEHLCLLWRVAQSNDQRALAVWEASALLPPLPAEADGWVSRPDLMAKVRERRAVSQPPPATLRSPSQIMSLVSRNEQIRSLAA